MSQNLITAEVILPSKLPPAQLLAEAATVLNISTERILEIQCWRYQLWVKIKGVGGKFVSYRQLPMWMQAATEAVKRCATLEDLQRLAALFRTEIKNYDAHYSPEAINQLRRCWKERLEEIQAEEKRLQPIKARQEAAYAWQQSWIHIIRYCESIHALQRLVKEIQAQSEAFLDVPSVLSPIEEFWAQRWKELMGTVS